MREICTVGNFVELIKANRTEFVGATIDTGNSTWTLEDPVETRNLAPYAVCRNP